MSGAGKPWVSVGAAKVPANNRIMLVVLGLPVRGAWLRPRSAAYEQRLMAKGGFLIG
jgi:hypothetical protein